jgi:hypothetical protein
VAVVVRLLPRHWDGRRLLQFLTGLALIALAFAAPALAGTPVDAPQEPAFTVVTTVDTPVAPARVEVGSPDVTAPDASAGAALGEAGGDDEICTDAAGRLHGTTVDANGERGPPRI